LDALEEVDNEDWTTWKTCHHRAAAGRGRADPICETLSIDDYSSPLLPEPEFRHGYTQMEGSDMPHAREEIDIEGRTTQNTYCQRAAAGRV